MLLAARNSLRSLTRLNVPSVLVTSIRNESTDLRRVLRLRNQKQLEYPAIETLAELREEYYLPSSFKTVRYGDYDFQQCMNGYVHIFIQAYKPNGLPSATAASFVVYYGKDHPLNIVGPVEREQDFCHARRYGFLRALEMMPQNLFSKTCFCVNGRPFIEYIDQYLREASDNSFRHIRSGRLMSDLETSMQINALLRKRNDLVLRLKYVPNAIRMPQMYKARRMAIKASEKYSMIMRHKKTNLISDEEFLLGE